MMRMSLRLVAPHFAAVGPRLTSSVASTGRTPRVVARLGRLALEAGRTPALALLAAVAAIVLGGEARAQNPNPHTPRAPSDAIEANSQDKLDESKNTEGDPVEPSTGNFTLEETDLALPGRGLSLSFTRHYRSGSVVHSTLGPKWDFNWNQYIALEWHKIPPIGGGGGGPSGMSASGYTGGQKYGITGAFYYNGTQRISMYDVPAPIWKSPASTFAKLRQIWPFGDTLPASFELRNPDGTIFTFGFNDSVDPFIGGRCNIYRLTRIEDRHGNAITLDYAGLTFSGKSYHRLDRVTDSYGQWLQFAYDPTTWLMTSVTDSYGRVVSFQHDADYNLTHVTSPAITGTPTPPNDFPNGRTTHYTYSQTVPMSEATSNLLQEAYAPQEWQNGQIQPATPYLQNVYDSSSRVTKQVFGGTNASTVPAGGTYAFVYESSLNGINHGWFTETSRTLTVDPNGNVRLAMFDADGSDRLSYQFTGRLDPNAIAQNPPTIDSILSITPAAPSTADHLSAPTETLRTNDPGCYWTRRDYNTDGLLAEETTAATRIVYTYDSASPDTFQKGNLVKFEEFAVGTNDPPLTTFYAYEPYFNQVRATIDPRGSASGMTLPNGLTASAADFMSKKIFDYQEADISAGALVPLATTWAIDAAQASQFALLPAGTLVSIDNDDGLGELNGDGSHSVGNVIVDRHPATHVFQDAELGTWSTPTAEVVTAFNAFSLPTSVTDEEGYVTTFEYFDVLHPWGQPGASVASANGGALQSIHHPLSITESFTYDSMGRQNSVTNPRNASYTTTTLYNQLGEVVTVTDARGYTTRSLYDWNGNVIQTILATKTPTFAGNGTPTGAEVDGPTIVDNFVYDILDHVVSVDSQLDGAVRGLTQYRYDRLGNRVLTMMPEIASSPSNFEAELPDERGLTWQFMRGGLSTNFRALYANGQIPELNTLPDSADETLVEKKYTLAGQIAELKDGEGHTSLYEYDGYQRLWKTTDPLLNYTELSYDPNDFVLESRSYGTGTHALLSRAVSHYDQRGRVYQQDADLFISGSIGVTESDGPLTPNDGMVTTRYVFDKRGLTTVITDDNKVSVFTQYDALGRAIEEHDELLNSTTYAYDKASNLVTVQETEVDPGGAPIVTRTDYFYDELNRQVAVLDNTNRTARTIYDSRGNVVCGTDAKSGVLTIPVSSLELVAGEHVGLSGVTNNHGNSVVNTFDEGGRCKKTETYLTINAVGLAARDMTQGGGDGKITITRTFDRNNRLVSISDDNGHPTIHHYDGLNRLRSSDAADGTTSTLVYDHDDLVEVSTDANGSVVTNVYDDAHRLTSRSIVRGTGVLGTTTETFTYDGLGRIKSAVDNDSAVNRVYDSLSRLVRDDINGRQVTSTYDGVGNLQRLIYPGTSTPREIVRSYDSTLGRLQSLRDAGSSDLAQFAYLGVGRLKTLDMPLIGTRLTGGYDGVRRVQSTDWTQSGGSVHIDQRSYTWDRASNKSSRTNHGNALVHAYTHDSADRMIGSLRSGSSPQSIAYGLDGAGNRGTVTGGSLPGSYTMGGVDYPVNQYTTIPTQTREYDDNGNLERIQGSRDLEIAYDYANRMVACYDTTTGFTHTYQYDVFGRRIGKVLNVGSANPQTKLYSYYGLNVVEEQDGGGVTQASYVWSGSMGGLLSMRRAGQDFYYATDDLGNVMKLIGSNGLVVESYDYEDFGKPLDGNSLAAIAGSAQGNPYLFSSGEWDAESALIKLGVRYLDPDSGRFTTRDPIGAWGDPLSRGNAYTYAGSNPWTWVDPLGTKSCRRRSAWEDFRFRRAAAARRRAIKGNTAHHGSASGRAPTSSTLGSWTTHGTMYVNRARREQAASAGNLDTNAGSGGRITGGTVSTGGNPQNRTVYCCIQGQDGQVEFKIVGYVDASGGTTGPMPVYEKPVRTGSDTFFSPPAPPNQEPSWVDNLQTGLDAAGCVDPTPICDGINALIYISKGEFGEAGISAGGFVPFVGDTLKVGRTARKIRKALDAVPTSVYRSVDELGVTRYVGITNDFARRQAEHLRDVRGIDIEPMMENLSRTDARAVEQALIELNGLSSTGGTLMNKINSIAKSNPEYANQLARGNELLRSAGFTE
ncbi:MAG: RHS repeat protein [Planctomycetes bacterium]|nr:RHS repeat protein [Planctomycetota bacterium]